MRGPHVFCVFQLRLVRGRAQRHQQQPEPAQRSLPPTTTTTTATTNTTRPRATSTTPHHRPQCSRRPQDVATPSSSRPPTTTPALPAARPPSAAAEPQEQPVLPVSTFLSQHFEQSRAHSGVTSRAPSVLKSARLLLQSQPGGGTWRSSARSSCEQVHSSGVTSITATASRHKNPSVVTAAAAASSCRYRSSAPPRSTWASSWTTMSVDRATARDDVMRRDVTESRSVQPSPAVVRTNSKFVTDL